MAGEKHLTQRRKDFRRRQGFGGQARAQGFSILILDAFALADLLVDRAGGAV
jgi:hypothetical protein